MCNVLTAGGKEGVTTVHSEPWEKEEEKWFFAKPFTFSCGWDKKQSLESKGVGTQYRWWKKHHRLAWRKRVFQRAKELSGHDLRLFADEYGSSKFDLKTSAEKKYGYRSWWEVSEALQGRVTSLSRKRSDQLLAHFLDAIHGVNSDFRDEAWELAAAIASATFAEMKPPYEVLGISFGGSRR